MRPLPGRDCHGRLPLHGDGPYGFLPTDPLELSDELAKRDLKVSAGTVGGAFHRADQLDQIVSDALDVARLAAAVGGRYLVLLPAMYRDLLTGEYVEAQELDEDGWVQFTHATEEVSRIVAEETGLRAVFHPHADSHVETQAQTYRWLEDTDPDVVGLCLDTGHIEYCGGDSAEIIRRYAERVEYMHVKQVDPATMSVVKDKDLGFYDAVQLGAICTPPAGVPTVEAITREMWRLDPEIFVIVEQDMFPCHPDALFPVAVRTAACLRHARLAR